jgi:hypothetical protein
MGNKIIHESGNEIQDYIFILTKCYNTQLNSKAHYNVVDLFYSKFKNCFFSAW